MWAEPPTGYDSSGFNGARAIYMWYKGHVLSEIYSRLTDYDTGAEELPADCESKDDSKWGL